MPHQLNFKVWLESVEPDQEAVRLLQQLKAMFTTPGTRPGEWEMARIHRDLSSLPVTGLEDLLNNWHYSFNHAQTNNLFLQKVDNALKSVRYDEPQTSLFGDDDD